MDRYNVDWLKITKGDSKLALLPKTTEEVSKILAYCNEKKLAVVPQGGNTGLVGGATPVFDEIIISLEKMNKVVSIDERSGIAVFEAGVILEKANELLEEKNLIFPLDLGAKGSCQIGGNIATNAGGLRVLRYGNLHGSVLGLEFVLPSGEVVDVLSKNKKDNTGLDVKQLLIGSEGILGIITKASVNCPPKCHSKQLLLLSVHSYADVVRLFQEARQNLGEILSAYEFWDSACTRGVIDNLPDIGEKMPDFFPEQQEKLAGGSSSSAAPGGSSSSSFGVLIETSGSNADHDVQKLYDFVEKFELESGAIAQDMKQYGEFWRFREDIPEAMMKDASRLLAYDVTLPSIENLYELVEKSRKFLAEKGLYSGEGEDQGQPAILKKVVGYGHVGDGNLHINMTVATKKGTSEEEQKAELEKNSETVVRVYEPFLWGLVSEMGGSISAEHGIGSAKTDVLHHSKNKEATELMMSIKDAVDPNGILNPYKVLCREKNPMLATA
eukprot:g15250.t1